MVVVGQNGHTAGANLVGGVPVSGHPVAAHHAGLHPAVFHHQGGHVVTDEGDVCPRLPEFIGGEPCPLKERAGLVGKDFQGETLFGCQVEGTLSGAVAGGGQRPSVAVGKHPVAWVEQGETVAGNFLAHVYVLGLDGQSLRLQPVQKLRQGEGQLQQGGHAPQCPGQIHRRGPGGGQIVRLLPQPSVKSGALHLGALMGQGGQAHTCAHPDGRGTPYPQGVDGLVHLPGSGQGEKDPARGQLGLVQNDDAGPVGTEADVFGQISHGIPPLFGAGPGCGSNPPSPGWPPPAAESEGRPPPAGRCSNRSLPCAPAAPCGQRRSTGRSPR